MNAYISVLRNINFRRLWLGQIFSQIALNMLFFVLAIRVYSETGSNTAVSLMLLTFGIPSIIFGILAGGIVDYFDKRQIMIFSNFSRIIILVLFFLFEKNLFMLYFLSVIISIVTQLFIPAEAPSIPNLVPNSQILSANSLFTISYYLSTVTGFLLAGPLLKILGTQYVLLPMILFMSAATYSVYYLPKMKSVRIDFQPNLTLNFFGNVIKEGIIFIKSNLRVEQSLILMTFSQVLISTLSVLAPGFADKILVIDLSDASLLVMGPAALGLIAGALWVGSYGRKFLKGNIILTGIIGSGSALILLSLLSRAHMQGDMGRNIIASILLLLLIGFFNAFVSVPANTILQQDSDEKLRGRVYGALTSLTGGVSLIPVFFSGILADFFGISRTLLIIGIAVLLISIYQYIKRQSKI